MAEAPAFFVPSAKPGKDEELYEAFAKMCRCPVPAPDQRIFSVNFHHDGDDWTATVGEPLRGTGFKTSRSGGKKVERSFPLSDPAIVLAIFPGEPHRVVTSAGFFGPPGRWANPFYVGTPRWVTDFSEAPS